jgi:hypothetical protein
MAAAARFWEAFFWSFRFPQADPLQSLLVTWNPGNPRGSISPSGPEPKRKMNDAFSRRYVETK